MSSVPPDEPQRAASQLIWNLAERHGRWPTYAVADRAIYKAAGDSLPEAVDAGRPS